jgi:hypothetical protein
MSVRVEWYEVGTGVPVLRVKGQHWNPDADEEEFTEVAPGVVETADPDDEVPTEVALVFSGNEAGVLLGTLSELRSWVSEASRALNQHEQAQREALATAPCQGSEDGKHEWVLVEDGYGRSWHTTLSTDQDGTITGIRALFSGSEDFTPEGEGEYLLCDGCRARMDVPDDVDVDYY